MAPNWHPFDQWTAHSASWASTLWHKDGQYVSYCTKISKQVLHLNAAILCNWRYLESAQKWIRQQNRGSPTQWLAGLSCRSWCFNPFFCIQNKNYLKWHKTIIGKNEFYAYFELLVWLVSRLQRRTGWDLWAVLQPASREWSRCSGLTVGELSRRPTLYTVDANDWKTKRLPPSTSTVFLLFSAN